MVFQEEVKGLAAQNRPKSCKIFSCFAIMGEKLLFKMGATIEQTKKHKPKKRNRQFSAIRGNCRQAIASKNYSPSVPKSIGIGSGWL